LQSTVTGNIENNFPLVIGGQNPKAGLFFTREIDDVRIYNFELTSSHMTFLAGP